MGTKEEIRFVYNTKTGVANVATKAILTYLHKKNLKDLRLMPVGWVPGDSTDVEMPVDVNYDERMLAAFAEKMAKRFPDLDDQEIRLAVADATGQQVAPPEDDIVQLFDPNALQEVVAAIAEMNPADKTEYTNSGKPDAKVLTQKLGRAVSAAERDQAFDIFKAPVLE